MDQMTYIPTEPSTVILTKKALHFENWSLRYLAPTLLDLLNVEQPEDMTGGIFN